MEGIKRLGRFLNQVRKIVFSELDDIVQNSIQLSLGLGVYIGPFNSFTDVGCIFWRKAFHKALVETPNIEVIQFRKLVFCLFVKLAAIFVVIAFGAQFFKDRNVLIVGVNDFGQGFLTIS